MEETLNENVLIKRLKKCDKRIKALFHYLLNRGMDVSLEMVDPFDNLTSKVTIHRIEFNIKRYENCNLFIDFYRDNLKFKTYIYVCKSSIIKTIDDLFDIPLEMNFEYVYSYVKNFFKEDHSDFDKKTNTVGCKIKIGTCGTIYARPLVFKSSANEEQIKSFLNEPNNKCNSSVLSKSDFPKCNFKKDKYQFFKTGEKQYDTTTMDLDCKSQFNIDRKLDLYYLFKNEEYNNGFKFKKKDDLKRHLYLLAKSRYADKYSDDELKLSLNYYFNKEYKISSVKKDRFINKAFANMNIWNYFVTFTYDDSLMNENCFQDKLTNYLRNIKKNSDVKYLGSFERSHSGRLHFHCVMAIPDSFVKNLDIQDEEYYEKDKGRKRFSPISQALKTKFGRCEFLPINSREADFGKILLYMCKYITKQYNSILCCRGLKTELYGFIPDFNDHIIGYVESLFHNSKYLLMDSETIFQGIES